MDVVLSCKTALPFHSYGGLEKYVYYFGKHLAENGINVEIVVSSDGTAKKEKMHEGVKYVFIPPGLDGRKLITPYYYVFNYRLARYLKNKEFDVLHAFDTTSYFYLHSERRAPTVVHLFMPFTTNFKKADFLTRAYSKLFLSWQWEYCLSHGDRVVAEGEFQVKDFMDGYGVPEKKILILPPGIESRLAEKGEKEAEHLRKKLGIGEKDFTVITVNRLVPEKGVNYLVESFGIVKQHLNDAKLIIVGSGPEESRIRDLVKRRGLEKSVIILKNIPEESLYGCYHLADLYASPVLQDDWVMGIVEAMASGLPIVSTGQKFLVRDGKNGYVVPKKNPGMLADAILKLYDKNRLGKMGNASKAMSKKYDWDFVAKTAIKKYEELLEPK